MKFYILFCDLIILLTFNYTFCGEKTDITQVFEFASGLQDEVVQSDFSLSEKNNIDQETKEIDLSKKRDF
jgi:hypothetical protein